MYFVTICVQNRERLFGFIDDGKMMLNELGKRISECWSSIPSKYPNASLDEWVVMPDHFHGIICINELPCHVGADRVGAGLVPAPTGIGSGTGAGAGAGSGAGAGAGTRPAPTGVPRIIGGFKSITTVEYIRMQRGRDDGRTVPKLWQRSYHDRIIRDDHELQRIRTYIQENPQKWHLDNRGDETSPLQVDEPADIG